MSSVVISAKIPKQLLELLRERKVNVSAVVREALEKEIAQKGKEEAIEELDKLKDSLSGKISTKDIVKAVRSSREER